MSNGRMSQSGQLSHKVAIVTGSSSGVGRAIALAFSQQGACVVCADLRPDARPEIKQETTITTHELIQKQDGKAIFQKTDVSIEEDIEKLVHVTVEVFGRLDIIVNNAGIATSIAKLHETSLDSWEKTMSVNLGSVFLGSKHAIAQMLKQKPLRSGGDLGWIINIASIAALVAIQGAPAYCASKGAITALTRQMAADYAKDKIHCNAICPGWIKTALVTSALEGQAPDKADMLGSLHPLKGLGEPNDIAKAAVFLASEGASWITGVALPVDGGFTVK